MASKVNNSRRRGQQLAAVAIGLTAALTLAACSPGSAGQSEGGSSSDSVVTLHEDRPDFGPAYKAASGALKQKLGYSLKAQGVPSVENYQQIIRSSLRTSSTTDLVKWWNGYRLRDLARSGGLADLTGAWDAAVKKGWVDPSTRDSFSYDGKVYGLPIYKSNWVVFYNKAVFDKVGITPPKTWAQFEQNNQKLKAAGVTPLFATQQAGWTAFIWFEALLSKTDPDLYKKVVAGEVKYTDPRVQSVMKRWSNMYSKKWFTAADTNYDNEVSLLASGKVAQTLEGTWRNGAIEKAMGDGTYGAYLLPTVDENVKPSVIVESGVFAMAKKAPNKAAAKKVMNNWLSPAIQKPWVAELKDTSANPKVEVDNKVLAGVLKDVQAVKPVPLVRYWEASPPALVQGAVKYLGAFMANPVKSNIEPTLTKIQSLSETEWANWKAAK